MDELTISCLQQHDSTLALNVKYAGQPERDASAVWETALAADCAVTIAPVGPDDMKHLTHPGDERAVRLRCRSRRMTV
jgi:hypothetical protein